LDPCGGVGVGVGRPDAGWDGRPVERTGGDEELDEAGGTESVAGAALGGEDGDGGRDGAAECEELHGVAVDGGGAVGGDEGNLFWVAIRHCAGAGDGAGQAGGVAVGGGHVDGVAGAGVAEDGDGVGAW